MILKPTRRDFLTYAGKSGLVLAAFERMRAQQVRIPGPGGAVAGAAAITPGNHTLIGGASAGTTPAIDTSGASLLVIGLSYFKGGGAIAAPTDSKSNTWTQLTAYNSGTDFRVTLFYATSVIVGTGHTFSFSQGSSFATLYVAAFNNTKTTAPFDVENGAGQAAGTTLQPGSITPSQNNELVITLDCINDATGAPTVDSGFTVLDSNAALGGTNVGGGLAYKVQTTAAAVNPTWTAAAQNYVASIASFKAP